MNNIYKVIWSKAKNCYVVASEIARSHTKSASGAEKIGGGTRRKLLASLMALSLLCGGLGVANAVDYVHVEESATSTTEVYTAGKVDTLLNAKADKTALDGKADKGDVDTNKAAIQTLETGKANTSLDNLSDTGKSVIKTTMADELEKKANASELGGKANTSLDNLSDAGKSVIKTTMADELEKKANASELGGKANTSLDNLSDAGVTKIKDTMSADMEKKADKNTVTALGGRVEGLETTVGGASKGLVKDVNDLKAQGTTLNIELGSKADKTDLEDATDRITTNETSISALQKKTTGLSADGKSLNGMNSVETDALTVKGEIKNGAGVTTTLTDIKASMEQTKTNAKAIDTLQTTTAGQADAIKDLKDRTTNISYDSGKQSTSINGIEIGSKQVDMGGKDLTDVGTINGIDLGTKQKGNYISQDGSIWGNMLEVDDQVKTNADAIAKETADRKAEIGELAVDGKYIKKGMNVSDNLVELDKQAKTNADNIQTNANNIKNNKDEIARVNGELVKTNDYFNKELGKTNDYFNTELGKTNAALQEEGKARAEADAKINTKIGNIDDTRTEYVKNANSISQNLTTLDEKLQATNDRTGGIKRNLEDTQTTIEEKVTVNKSGDVAGVKNLSAETITTTGNASIGGDLKVAGTITTDKMIFGDKATNNYTEIDKGHITSKNDALASDATKKSSSMELDYTKLEVAVADKDSNGHLKMTADQTSIKNSDLDGKNYSEIVADKDSVTTTVKDEKDNTTSTKSSATEIRNYAKDKDGNKTINAQTATQNKSWAKDKDGNESSIVQTGKDITNTAKQGTITNTAQNVTNEGTESVTNKVGANEVKVSTDGVDITAADGKKITESVGTASRVVENDKITDEAGDSTVTTENGKGTTFGKVGSTDTTNIYGDSIKTGKINAKDTTTDKLTAGVAADVDGGRLTVDADGVKGSYKSGNYTSKSYILANTLKSGVDNGKEPTDADYVGSRTDHYMEGNKAKLDETVKDADGSNVTNKTSTSTTTTIKGKDGNTTSSEMTSTTITNKAADTIKDKAGDYTVTTDKDNGTTFGKEGSTKTTNIKEDNVTTGTIKATDTITGTLTAGVGEMEEGSRLTVDDNGVKGSVKSDKYTSKSYILKDTLQSGVDNGKDITDNGFVGSRTDHYMDGDKAKLNETVKDADGSNVTKKTSTKTYTEIKDTNGNTNHVTNSATQSKQTLKDKDGNTLTTNQTATKNNFDLKSADGSKENHTTNTVDESRVAIKGENGKAELSTTDEGTTFKHSAAKEAFTEGGPTNTTIKGNTITTGKVTMDYAEVMKDLGVHGNATVDKDMTVKGNTTLGEAGKDTTLTVNSKATFNEIATFENGAEVKNGLTVSSGGLNVTGESTFNDKVTMKNGLDVTGGVASDSFTVKGTDIKIDSSGINAGGTVISNVADGSISEGSKDAVNGGQLYQVKNDLEGKVNKVGANAAAMANLHPMEFDPDSKWNIAAAMGNYGSETATAIGAFYRPNEDVMVNFSTAFGTGENMVGGGVSVRLGKGSNKLSRQESNALKAQVNDLTARMDALLSVLNPNMSKDFPDVPENHWAYEAVSRLAGNDIVQGYPDGEFHGDRTMTRYEMAEIIYNALSRGAEAERELVEEFKPELQAMAASEKATAERAQG